MNLNIDSKLGVQSAALIGATVVSALHAAKNIQKVFLGTDNISTRTNNWSQASNQKGYLSSIGKRIQFFVGSDSLSQRVSNLFQGLVMGVASIVMADLARVNKESSKTATDLRTELDDINLEASNAKDIAGKYIEACLNENQAEKVKDLIVCLTKAFSSMNETLTTTSSDLDNCQSINKNLNFDFGQKKEDFANLETSNAKLQKDQDACITVRDSKDSLILSLKQEIQALGLKVSSEVAKRSNFTTTFKTLTDDLAASAEKVERLDPENVALKLDIEKLNGEIASIRAQRDQANQAKQTAENSLATEKAQLTQCQTDLTKRNMP